MRPVFLAVCAASLAGAQTAKPVDFTREIRPILSDNCFTCHGPDDAKRMANLRLDTRDGALKVIVPGKPGESKLVLRAAHEKRALRMPPPSTGATLTDAQIALLTRWVAEGAQWQLHWAYETPKRPTPPEVKLKDWARNDIDRFVLAKLEKENVKPSPEAGKATLLRRVTLDLTGLPPTAEEVDAFVKDRSPGAYEKRVDALLASPHFGERMAMQWLDLARYADTHGYHIDSHRDMWPWRDWVISAFNRNMPFDQFTVWQLAGDLLPDATREQKLASGFNRNHMINYEGGAIPEEYQIEYVVDRVEATSSTWLATTMGCSRCHDHKYDPIKQRDFYQMFAFFNTISEKGLDGRDGNAEPFLPLPTPDQEARMAELKQAIKNRESQLDEKEIAARQTKWEEEWRSRISETPSAGLTAWYELDGSVSDLSGNFRHGRIRRGDLTFAQTPTGRGADFDGETLVDWGNNTIDAAKPFTVAFQFRSSRKEAQLVVAGLGLEIGVDDTVVLPHLKRGQRVTVRVGPQAVRTKEFLIQGNPYHVAVRAAGPGGQIEIWVNGANEAVETFTNPAAGPAREALQTGRKDLGFAWRGRLDDLRFYQRALSPAEIGQIAVHYPMETLAGTTGKRTKEQTEKLREYYLANVIPDPYRSAYNELQKLKRDKEQLADQIPTVMMMEESEKPRETFILARGDYTQKRDKVTPAVPGFLPALPKDAPPNRLGFAKWLTDPSHPLTARVAVNRYWQMYFGTGIVKTLEDFGSQGEPPSHPELLDWLATEFVRTGWDVKAMQRLIVTSAAYRQSSRVTPEMTERDPENRLLARGPRFRLPAELVRDNALTISGLLKPQIGGPSVLPYQPAGVWEELAYGDVFSAQTYVQDHGDKLYRRGMYTFWKRTAPPAMLTTFDAPDREKCTARRAVTNTPLQALALLNDTTFVEASRSLATRVLTSDAKASDPARIRRAFQMATARQPNNKELEVLRGALRRQTEIYARDPKAAASLLAVGETPADSRIEPQRLAAWTNLCSVILNLDETVTKE